MLPATEREQERERKRERERGKKRARELYVYANLRIRTARSHLKATQNLRIAAACKMLLLV